ncbi:glutamine ABC transporter substrate-binding protein (plasmid) [Azospirillum brasilense]|uniref:Glutamine ABC transporter substrate-binding protein n=1 Tax=Azospirillum brasilense TaxID=192 RepID=A0A4D8RAW3_AZOBR|nr:glutamine ABC transporter substrate-binding protein [Azospirillum brasilense]QCO18554.1 glutamine ABC transporter substrate-binding protein [Azospirillum brasilense]
MKSFGKFLAAASFAAAAVVTVVGAGSVPARAEDAVIASIKQSGTFRVGVDATFAPFEFSQDGKKTGFDIELVEAIAKELGATKGVEWVDIDFKGLIPGLMANRFDMIASAMYITEERRKVVAFSDTYYPGGLVIMVKANNSAVKGPADLEGKTAAVQIGTKSVVHLKEHFPKTKIVEVETNAEMFGQVETGRTDVAVTGKPAAKLYAQTHPTVKVLDDQLTTEDYGFAMRKDNTELVTKVNAAIAKLKADGTYQKLIDKWFEAKK